MSVNDESGQFRSAASWASLQQRAQIRRQVRRFFEELGFVEVETPVLSADSIADLHVDPLPVTVFDDPRSPEVGQQLWLQTSPEFAMKRLLASGAERIFQFSRAFRGGERGRLHNPEFTLVEWYRVGDDYARGMDLLADLAEEVLHAGRPERLSYAEAFERFVGLDPHRSHLADFRKILGRLEAPCPFALDDADIDDWRHWLLTECVEPRLGTSRPTILFDYPATQASLANVRDGDPPVAERFELYFRGIELANGFHELWDGEELLRRAKDANRQRIMAGKYPLPEQSRLLQAMQQGRLPPCCGTALGFDRLVMLAIGASSIDQVIAFPIDRA